MSTKKPQKKRPKKKKRVGRPNKNEAWRLNRFIQATRDGLTRKHAAQYAGIALSTAEKYLAAGKDADPQFAEFAEAVMAAEAEGVSANLKTIKKHSRKDWRAAAWILNNRHGDEYKSKQVVAGDPDAPLGVKEVHLPPIRKEDE